MDRPAQFLHTTGTVGRPKKKEPTRTLRVYGRQQAALQQIAGALRIDTSDLVEATLDALIRDKAPEVEAVMEAIRQGATPQKAKSRKTPE
jgi:hypothetical protein